MVVTIHKTQAKALGSDVQRSFKITCMFLRSWLSVRASEPCPIMISNRSKGLLRQIGARVDFLRKLKAIQHTKFNTSYRYWPSPPHRNGQVKVFSPYPLAQEYSIDQQCQRSDPHQKYNFPWRDGVGGRGGQILNGMAFTPRK